MGRTEIGLHSYRTVSISSTRDKKNIFNDLISLSNISWPLFFCGVFFGRALIFNELIPFGIAYYAAVRTLMQRKEATIQLIGVMLGLITIINQATISPYLAGLMLLFLVGDGPRNKEKNYHYWLLWIAVSFILIRGPIGYVFYPVPMNWFNTVFETGLALAIYSLLHHLFHSGKAYVLAPTQIQLGLLLIAAVLGINLTVYGISLRYVICCYLVLGAAKIGGVVLASVMAAGLGVISILLNEPISFGTLLIGIGVISGLISRLPGGIVLGGVIATLLIQGVPVQPSNVPYIFIIFLAAGLVYLTPGHLLRQLERVIPGTELYKERQITQANKIRGILERKLNQSANVFDELANTMKTKSKKGKDVLLVEQLSGIADIVRSLSFQMQPQVEFSEEIEGKLIQHINSPDLKELTVIKSYDGYDIYGARNTPCNGKNWCQNVTEISSQLLGSSYQVAANGCITEGECSFRIEPKPEYRLEVKMAKVASEGVSGDSNMVFQLSSGKIALLVSDGMGKGQQAANESTAAVRLLEKLIRVGYPWDVAIRIVNRALLIRSAEEMFATIDLAVVDLQNGLVEFVKIGSAPSFIKRGRDIEIVRNRALPAGILKDVDVEQDRRLLKEGEYLIMITDGILDSQRHIIHKDQWFCRILRRLDPSLDTQELSKELMKICLEKSSENRDDMMILVAKLIRDDGDIISYRRKSSAV
ncbi:MAG: SpoIIE family protein phosphatase [Firmicutes bacterium]|nr:SpoIIE family protein phosphatase [Bacillota bacterium]